MATQERDSSTGPDVGSKGGENVPESKPQDSSVKTGTGQGDTTPSTTSSPRYDWNEELGRYVKR